MFGFVEVFLRYALEKILFLCWAVGHSASLESYISHPVLISSTVWSLDMLLVYLGRFCIRMGKDNARM